MRRAQCLLLVVIIVLVCLLAAAQEVEGGWENDCDTSNEPEHGVECQYLSDRFKGPDEETIRAGHCTYHGKPFVPSVRDGGCSGISLAYVLLETIGVLKRGCTRGRSKAREAEFIMLSLMVDMVAFSVAQ